MGISNTQFQLQHQHHAQQIKRLTRADGICLFLFDRSNPCHPVSFLHNTGIPTQAENTYSSKIYQHDPFLQDALLAKNKQAIQIDISAEAAARRPAGAGNPYTRFLGKAGFKETAASLQPLSNNIFLVVGLLLTRQSRYHHINIDPAISTMENWLREGSDFLVEQSLRALHFGQQQRAPIPPSHIQQLSPRETQLLEALCRGQSNKQISQQLSLSEYTVENYLRRLYKKFAVNNRTALLAKVTHLS